MHVLLEFALEGELGAIAPAFRGWRLDARHGELVSPEAWRFTPGEICSLPLQFGLVRELQRQVRELVTAIEGRADRRARLEALAMAGQGLQLLQRALEQLARELTARERDRLFELSPSRKRIDAGDAPPGAPCSPASTGRDGA